MLIHADAIHFPYEGNDNVWEGGKDYSEEPWFIANPALNCITKVIIWK